MTTLDASPPCHDEIEPEPEPGERLRRDEPARTGPDRQPANVLLPGAGETVDGAVKLAYKVLGDYLRRGLEAAQTQGQQNGERKNPWVFPTAQLPTSLTAIPVQLFRAWAQLAATWAELSMIPGAAEGVRQMSKLAEDFWAVTGVTNGDASNKPEAQPNGKPSRSPIRCAVELASSQPVEVDIEFDPPADVVPMIQRLHPLRGDAAPLTGLEFEFDAQTGRAKLSLAVPPGQEPGRYVGTIFDDRDDRVCGAIRVRVGD